MLRNDTPGDGHIVVDRALLRRRLARAALRPQPGAWFLRDHVVAECLDRLALVNRSFARAVDISGWTPDLSTRLLQNGIAARVARLSPLVALDRPDAVIDDEIPPLGPAASDLVVSALGLQFVNDLPGVFAQIRGGLRADGLFLAAVVGGDTLHELRDVLAEAELEICGGVSPRILPFADIRDYGGLLQRAGFALPVTDRDRLTVRYPAMDGLMADLRAMGATNVLVERSRRPTPRRVFDRAGELYRRRHSDADGRIRATFEIVWLSGWAPHPDQQQPLKPGSARARLADALGTTEHPSRSRD